MHCLDHMVWGFVKPFYADCQLDRSSTTRAWAHHMLQHLGEKSLLYLRALLWSASPVRLVFGFLVSAPSFVSREQRTVHKCRRAVPGCCKRYAAVAIMQERLRGRGIDLARHEGRTRKGTALRHEGPQVPRKPPMVFELSLSTGAYAFGRILEAG